MYSSEGCMAMFSIVGDCLAIRPELQLNIYLLHHPIGLQYTTEQHVKYHGIKLQWFSDDNDHS